MPEPGTDGGQRPQWLAGGQTGGEASLAAGETAESLFSQGLDNHDRGDFDKAIECYRKVIQLDPTFVVAHNNLGMVYIDKDMFEEAIGSLKKTLELEPNYAEAYNNLGFVYRRLGDEIKAAAHYRKFLALEPDVEDGPKIQAWLEGVIAEHGELPPVGPEAAAANAPTWVSVRSDLPGIPTPPTVTGTPTAPVGPAGELKTPARVEKLSWLTDGAGEPAAPAQPPAAPPPPQAPPAAPQVAKMPPAAPQVAKMPPAAPQVAKMPPAAAAGAMPTWPAGAPSAASPAGELPEVVCEKGIAAFEKGDLAQAEGILLQALDMNPNLAVAHSALGRVLAKAERYEAAAAELKKAISLDATDAAAFYVLGYALRSLQRDIEAAEAYERYLELTPDATDAPQIRSWMAEVRSAVSPDDLYRHACAAYQQGYVDQALEDCEQALQLADSHAGASVLLGRILVEKGDYLRAVPVLNRAERAQPDIPEIHFYLGQAYEKRGLQEDARTAYERFLGLSPAGPQADIARAFVEQASKAGAAVAGARCEYCFRTFPQNVLSRHEGKAICPDCLASVSLPSMADQGLSTGAVVGFERAAAAEAAEARRMSAGTRRLFVFMLSVGGAVAVLAVLLTILLFGVLQGPLDAIGVYSAIEAVGLRQPLETIGVPWPAEAGPVGPTGIRPPRSGKTTQHPTVPDGVDPGVTPTPVRSIILTGPAKPLVALPYAPLAAKIAVEGATTEPPAFRLVEGPQGMKVDEVSGKVSWTWKPSAGEAAIVSRHTVKVEALAGGGTGSVGFEVLTGFAFGLGPGVDAGIEPGVAVQLATGKLDVSMGRNRDDVAVAWGHYDEGKILFLYGQDTPGNFAGAPTGIGGMPSALALADFTGDGRTDVVVANWYTGRLCTFRQSHDGHMEPGETLRSARGVDCLTAGDVDGDGRADLLASHWTDAVLDVYLQRKGDDGTGRLAGPDPHPTGDASGWDRVFVGPLRDGIPAVYLLSGGGIGPFFKMFSIIGEGRLGLYDRPKSGDIFPKDQRPLDARLVRTCAGGPLIAALTGGEKPALFVIGGKAQDLALAAKPVVDLPPYPAGMTAADLNGDEADDIVVLYPEELRVFLSEGAPEGPFTQVATVGIPPATGPVVAGEFTGDGLTDILVLLDGGKLQVVRAVHGSEGTTP